MDIVHSLGFDISVEDLRQAVRELQDNELDNVAGGIDWSRVVEELEKIVTFFSFPKRPCQPYR